MVSDAVTCRMNERWRKMKKGFTDNLEEETKKNTDFRKVLLRENTANS